MHYLYTVFQRFNGSTIQRGLCIPVLAMTCFLLATEWAKHSDRFRRIEFSLKTTGGKVKAIAVLPKPDARFPVVICLHGSGGTLTTDGKALRQIAELGMVAVGLEYDQTNQAAFDEQFVALQQFVQHQPWAQSNAIAWVGMSLGAERTLRFILDHPETQPRLLVQLSGGWDEKLGVRLPDVENQKSNVEPGAIGFIHCLVLLVHSDDDTIFPLEDTRRLAVLLDTNHVPVNTCILSGVGHNFGADWPVVLREAAEYCRAHLPLADYTSALQDSRLTDAEGKRFNLAMQRAGQHRRELLKAVLSSPEPERRKLVRVIGGSNDYDLAHASTPFRFHWNFWTPFVLVGGAFVLLPRWRRSFVKQVQPSQSHARPPGSAPSACSAHRSASKSNFPLKTLAAISATAACSVTGLHLLLPRVSANHDVLELTRKFLVEARLRNDFDYLIQHSYSDGQPLAPLLTHVELANLQRNQFYSNLSESVFRDYILSPEIDPLPLKEVNWRRTLWESFYPRVRHETDPLEAAQTVVHFLRERVGIDPTFNWRVGVETIWTEQMTDEVGFERIYVAALRSVGIAARLDDKGQAELLEGDNWQPAPRLQIYTFGDKSFLRPTVARSISATPRATPWPK